MNGGLRAHSPALAHAAQRALMSTHLDTGFVTNAGFGPGVGVAGSGVAVGRSASASGSHRWHDSGQAPCINVGFRPHSPALAHPEHSDCVSTHFLMATEGGLEGGDLTTRCAASAGCAAGAEATGVSAVSVLV